jgi:hypothetical protein
MILRVKIRHWAVFNLALVLVSTSAIGVMAGEWITSAGS